jgi:hypothetical protein
MNKLKMLVMSGVVGAGMLAGYAVPAVANAEAPVVPVTQTADASVRVAGPYYTYARAADVADDLEDLGFVTRIVYQYGYWWVYYG